MKFSNKLSLSNYTAISILERLGLLNPTQEQIDIMESMVLIATHPQKISTKKMKLCVGNNELAYSFLHLGTVNK